MQGLLHVDSQYVLKGMTEWLPGWKAKGWKTASKQPVKNVDLWQLLDAMVTQRGHQTSGAGSRGMLVIRVTNAPISWPTKVEQGLGR